jgi:hypothetical protein
MVYLNNDAVDDDHLQLGDGGGVRPGERGTDPDRCSGAHQPDQRRLRPLLGAAGPWARGCSPPARGTVFNIDPVTGGITIVGGSPFAGSTFGEAWITADGRRLFVASFSGGGDGGGVRRRRCRRADRWVPFATANSLDHAVLSHASSSST